MDLTDIKHHRDVSSESYLMTSTPNVLFGRHLGTRHGC